MDEDEYDGLVEAYDYAASVNCIMGVQRVR